MFSKQKLLNIRITNASEKEILEYIIKTIEKNTEKYYITTPNPEILVYANHHPSFKTILDNARLALPDGIGIILAGKFLGKPFKERVTGVDLMKNLCKLISEKPITVGFLGGRDGVAEKTAECLLLENPNLKISFIGEKWGEEGFILANQKSKIKNQKSKTQFKAQNLENKEKILNTKYPPATQDSLLALRAGYIPNTVDVLFVAFGFPKQEEWIAENLPRIPVKAAIGVGGAFDYISDRVERAPVWMQKLGFEWLYRLIRQPWRIKRQLALLEFIRLVIKEKLPVS